jgi:phosphoheptose isomerase
MNEKHRRPATGVHIKDAGTSYIDETFFEPKLRGLLLHGRKSFLAIPLNRQRTATASVSLDAANPSMSTD